MKQILRFMRDYAIDMNSGNGTDEIKYDEEEWMLSSPKSYPLQMNGVDCGVFMCIGIRNITQKRLFLFSEDMMLYFRKHIIVSLLKRRLEKKSIGKIGRERIYFNFYFDKYIEVRLAKKGLHLNL